MKSEGKKFARQKWAREKESQIAGESAPMTSADTRALWIVLGCALLLCLNALANPFVLDDVTKIIENLDIRSLGNIPDKLVYPYHAYQVLQRNDPSRPLVFFAYTILYAMGKLNPFGYHLVNAIFHGLTGGLVFLIARRIQQLLYRRADWRAALVPALLFVANPIQMGTAIYAYAMSDVLSTFFMFLAFWFYVRQVSPSLRDYAKSLVAFALAFSCKQSVIVLPALLVLFDFAFICEARWDLLKQRIRKFYPHFAFAGLYLVFRWMYFGGVGDLEGYFQTPPALSYAFTEPLIVWKYLIKTLVPTGLAIDHHLNVLEFPTAIKALSLVAWLLVCGWVFRRALKNRDPESRLWAFGLIWFWFCLAPTSSVLPTVDLMVERRVYPANLGIFLLILAAYDRWGSLAFRSETWKRATAGIVAAHVLVLGGMSIARNRVFSSPELMWRSVLEVYPKSQRGLDSLANILAAESRFEEAHATFEKIIALYPDDYTALGNFGSLMERPENPRHDIGRAIQLFEASARVNPKIAENYYNIGRLLHLQHRLAEALPLYEKTLELKPEFVPAMNNIAAIYLDQHRFDDAARLLQETLRRDPSYEPAIKNAQILQKVLESSERTKIR